MRRVVRVLGMVLAGVLVLLVLAVGGIYFNAQRVLGVRYDNAVAAVRVAGTPEQVERGRYLVSVMPACIGCHSSNVAATPPLLDGKEMTDLAALGTFYAPNLTPGRLRDWSDGEIVRAIREGVGRDGRGLIVMPAAEYRHLSDEDAQAIVAYLRAQPAVQKETPLPRLTFLGSMLLGTGLVTNGRQEPVRDVRAPVRGPSAEYGRYLSETSGCQSCHGPRLDGEDIPTGPPKGPSLRVVKGWTEEQFVRTLRQGVDPSGHQLSDDMPWRQMGRGTDDDLRALYAMLRALP